MKYQILSIAFFASLCFSIASNAQQLKVPAPSPLQTVKQAFALSDISIEYSRPSVKGRTIYGDLVPFGKIWRTGANAATQITFGEDVKVEGNSVPAGTYAIYTIPGKAAWEIILYKDLKLGGNVSEFNKENELLRFSAKTSALDRKIETFTIGFADITPTSLVVEFLWEKTRVAFNVVSDIDAKVMNNIESSMAKDSRPYYQAANYYFENNKDLNQALTWINTAVEQNPKAFWMLLLKAKIQLKLNDKTAAIASAKKVIEIAKEEGSDDYVKLGEKFIADAK
ncbi:MAG: DUF2911 domain-containing protein [Crocinitomicaceae bacterium]|nr:DUF2911 domain-containing protein [Crocinitomicaceae bacterium]